jgi:hypothetical protein
VVVVVSFKGVWRRYFDTGVASLQWVKAEMSQSWGRGYFEGGLRGGLWLGAVGGGGGWYYSYKGGG